MSFYGVTDIWTYALGALGIILLPGPNSLFVLSVATARGVKAGYHGAMGVFVGDAVLLTLTALGAASLLHTYPALFMVVKYAGAGYLTEQERQRQAAHSAPELCLPTPLHRHHVKGSIC